VIAVIAVIGKISAREPLIQFSKIRFCLRISAPISGELFDFQLLNYQITTQF